MQNFLKKTSCVLVGLSLLMGSASADWALDNDQSSLYFASTKKEVVSEVHRFKALKGSITEKGVATLEIDLSSVDTKERARNKILKWGICYSQIIDYNTPLLKS